MSASLWSADEIAAATGGRAGTAWAASGVSIDSRSLRTGDLFVALRGPQFDGHEFVAGAFARGAAGALVHRAPAREDSHGWHDRLILVKDTFHALQDLGRASRARTAARVVAVTGSVGKTSTKEGLKVALGVQGKTYGTEGNLNNHWGVPLSLARMARDSAYGVFELGMNHPGEIAPLSRQVRPHVAVITTVEAVHLEFFGSVAAIAEEKASVMAGLEPGGAAVLPCDSPSYPQLVAAATHAGCRTVGFGSRDGAEALLVAWSLTPSGTQVAADIGGQRLTYEIGAVGRPWAVNSVAVLAAVQALGADVKAAAAALARLTAPEGRGSHRAIAGPRGTFTLIDDSYNASPASVRATAESLGAMGVEEGRRILVLGDMLELGPSAGDLHASLAPALRNAGIDLVFTAGPLMERLHQELPREMRGGHGRDAAQLAPLVARALRAGDVVAVKGSHGSRMDTVVAAFAALHKTTPANGN